MKLLILGAGYSARQVSIKLAPLCDSIKGTTRSINEFSVAASSTIDPLFFNGISVSDELSGAIKEATHLLVSIPPPSSATNASATNASATNEQYKEGFEDPLVALVRSELSSIAGEGSLVWMGYLSTVGVYGNFDGAWVDESTQCKPVSARSIARLRAEKAWRELSLSTGIPLCILRLSGIYGPGRNALVNLSEGRARRIVKPGQVFNRIHVGDIATAVKLAAAKLADGIFNITDDCPAPPQDVVSYAARLMGMEEPPVIPFEIAPLSPMGRSFYGENKRVSNSLSKKTLGMVYEFPGYREGIDSLWVDNYWNSSL